MASTDRLNPANNTGQPAVELQNAAKRYSGLAFRSVVVGKMFAASAHLIQRRAVFLRNYGNYHSRIRPEGESQSARLRT